eukprot:5479327-Amphidinium_carterae.1
MWKSSLAMTGQPSPRSAMCNPMGRRGGSTMRSGADRTAQRNTQRRHAAALRLFLKALTG